MQPFVILYVDDPLASSQFYAHLLDIPVLESSATFALLPLQPNVMLGLWSRHTVLPAANNTGGGMELAFPLPNKQAVDERYADWIKRGVRMAQAPTQLDFGYAFFALDADGHRLRIFVPTAHPQ